MTDTAHIDPGTAEELYDGEDGDVCDGWTRVADRRDRDRRWMQDWTLILRSPDGLLWGLSYQIGLTEHQEHAFPWRDAAGPLPLTRLYAHTVTHTVYRTVPPDGGDQ